MQSTNVQIGRVLRVGRGWVEVTIDHKVRRISARPDLLVRTGSYVQILHDQGIAVLPSYQDQTPYTFQ